MKTHGASHEDDDVESKWNQPHKRQHHSRNNFKVDMITVKWREPLTILNNLKTLSDFFPPNTYLTLHSIQPPKTNRRVRLLHGSPYYKLRSNEKTLKHVDNYKVRADTAAATASSLQPWASMLSAFFLIGILKTNIVQRPLTIIR